ncbi:MAG: 4-hydroxy-2-oxo-heptane-1,7-dioate aldolase [Pseudooceanicola sp.]|nr:4-hydroxy-2-oxo-heptane-1,7-dioate aldolase [Pseudooceanicola sp.]
MDLPKNAFKAALSQGKRQIGYWCSIRDTLVVEMLAGCGYEWLLLDTEHAPMAGTDTLPLMQAAAPYPVSCVVRPAWNDTVEIKKLLDCGAQSLLIPYVQNADEAAQAVKAMHYPPRGVRGVAGATRASRFGTIKDYGKRASEELCLLVQVETAAALAEIEAIAAVDGVDGIFIGPADLAASMGYPGEPSHPEVRKAVVDATKRIRAAGKPPGFLSTDMAFCQEVSDAGALFLAVGVDSIGLRMAATSRRDEWR